MADSSSANPCNSSSCTISLGLVKLAKRQLHSRKNYSTLDFVKSTQVTFTMLINSEDLGIILERIRSQISAHKSHQSQTNSIRSFPLCLSGLQGSGKSTWASSITKSLRSESRLKILVLSLDDLYYDHTQLIRIRKSNLSKKLLRTRGQPGTHDENLAQKFFDSLRTGESVRVSAFDKSRFNGEGDRVSEEEWEIVPANPPIDVVVFEWVECWFPVA
jgi:D-glycerate 3-kinase